MSKPCLTCGEPSPASYCNEHEPRAWQHREGSARARGYSTGWDKLSRRARKLQPFCSDCGALDDLQLDHTARTWERIDAGKVVRLKDTGGVVCGPCNRRRGAGRGRETHGTGTLGAPQGPGGKAQSPLLSDAVVEVLPRVELLLRAELACYSRREPPESPRPVAESEAYPEGDPGESHVAAVVATRERVGQHQDCWEEPDTSEEQNDQDSHEPKFPAQDRVAHTAELVRHCSHVGRLS